MKRIGVLTSGGDAPGMNAAVRAVVRTARANNMSVVGFKRGYNGMLMRSLSSSDDYFEMNSRSVSGIIHHGGTVLMTARCMEFYKEEFQRMAVRNAKALDIEGIVCIGGNGTFKGAEGLNRLGLPAVGVPATIDNDLCYTEFTIGFDTALNTAVEAVNRIRDTGDAHERVFIVTVMGRDCGDLAVHTALACGAEAAIVPEVPWSIEKLGNTVHRGVVSGKRSMILIFAEGAQASMQEDIAYLKEHYPKLHVNADKLSSFLRFKHLFVGPVADGCAKIDIKEDGAFEIEVKNGVPRVTPLASVPESSIKTDHMEAQRTFFGLADMFVPTPGIPDSWKGLPLVMSEQDGF